MPALKVTEVDRTVNPPRHVAGADKLNPTTLLLRHHISYRSRKAQIEIGLYSVVLVKFVLIVRIFLFLRPDRGWLNKSPSRRLSAAGDLV